MQFMFAVSGDQGSTNVIISEMQHNTLKTCINGKGDAASK
jgi:hypothetical protein